MEVSVHQSSEGRHRRHGLGKRSARHLGRTPRDLDQKPDGGALGADDGLHSGATLPADRCYLNDAAVRINRHRRANPAVGEEYVVERTIGVDQKLLTFAGYAFKLRHKPPEVGGWKGE